jgi:acyl-coenzyme A synthetase/AMP-(fatty) acid ligase
MSDVAAEATLAGIVRARGKALGDATLYEFEGRTTGFGAFDRSTNRVANALKALGVRPGERIAYFGKTATSISSSCSAPSRPAW